MWVDSHCHLDILSDASGQSVSDILNEAKRSGVEHCICVDTDLNTAHRLQRVWPNNLPAGLSVTAGLHPTESVDLEPSPEYLVELAQRVGAIALGETGLDYLREHQASAQQRRFHAHLEAAQHLKLPVIVHTRQARQDTLAILRQYAVQGVLHCFTEDWEMAKKALDLDFYISFSGIVTFKNATELQKIATQVPADRILIETDSPYLAPVPHRGKTNTPAFLPTIGTFIAQLRQEKVEYFGKITRKNTYALFQNIVQSPSPMIAQGT